MGECFIRNIISRLLSSAKFDTAMFHGAALTPHNQTAGIRQPTLFRVAIILCEEVGLLRYMVDYLEDER